MRPSATHRAVSVSACAGLVLAASAALTGTAGAAPGRPDPVAAPAAAAVRVSLSAPDSVRRGKPADLGAVVSAPDTGGRVPGVVVILFGRPGKGGAWTEAARAVTDLRGLAAFRTAPRRTTDYAAESLAGAGHTGGLSGVVRVKVHR